MSYSAENRNLPKKIERKSKVIVSQKHAKTKPEELETVKKKLCKRNPALRGSKKHCSGDRQRLKTKTYSAKSRKLLQYVIEQLARCAASTFSPER